MAVVIMFALCWLPIHVIMVMRALQVYINTPLSITIQVEKGLIKIFYKPNCFKYYENNSCYNSIINLVHQIISHILAYSNSCVNPILYAFLSEPFRRGFWAIITCIRPSGPHGMQHNGYEMAEMKKKKEGKIIICSL